MGLAAILSVDPGADFDTTYAGAVPAARVADIAAGLGLLVAGALASTQPRTRRLGVLATLADDAPLPVELGEASPERQPPGLETTAHVIIAEAIEDATRRGATFVSAGVRRERGRLVVAVDDDGAPRRFRPVHLADRVVALAGSLHIGDTSLRAEFPCE